MKQTPELVKMVIELNDLLIGKKEVVMNERDWNAYDMGKEKNILEHIARFEESIQLAVSHPTTVSNFRKDFESIKSDIDAL